MSQKYRVLAFIVLLKKHRINSMIYCYDNRIVLAKTLGISYNSFTKYLNICKQEGIIVPKGKHLQTVGLVQVMEILNIKEKFSHHHHFCHTFQYHQLNFKNVYEQIIQSILLVNYERQAYNIERNKILFSRSKDDSLKAQKYTLIKSLVKKAAKQGVETDKLITYIQSRKINKIVSGKFHVANLLGYSQSSGLRWLRKLHKEKVIRRRVCIKQIKTSCPFPYFDFHYRRIGESKIVPVSSGFKEFLGSSITPKGSSKGVNIAPESNKKGTNLKPKDHAK